MSGDLREESRGLALEGYQGVVGGGYEGRRMTDLSVSWLVRRAIGSAEITGGTIGPIDRSRRLIGQSR